MRLMSTWGVGVILSRVDGGSTPAGGGYFFALMDPIFGLVVELSSSPLRSLML